MEFFALRWMDLPHDPDLFVPRSTAHNRWFLKLGHFRVVQIGNFEFKRLYSFGRHNSNSGWLILFDMDILRNSCNFLP